MKQLSYMESEAYLLQRNSVGRYVKISFLLHLALLGFFFIMHYFFSGIQPMVLPTVQVDMVSLPDFTKNNIPLDDVKKIPVIKDVPKAKSSSKDSSMVLKKNKTKKSIEKIKEKVRKRKLKELSESRSKEQEALKKFQEKYRAMLAGNQKNEGDSISGSLETSINNYVSSIVNQIRDNWELPLYLQDKGYRASVMLYIDKNGNTRYEFTKTSGNDIFDELVQNALELSIPFSKPPADIISLLKNKGIEVLFPL